MPSNSLKKIKIDTEDEVKGFYKLVTASLSSTVCLPDNEYIVSEDALIELREEKIKFNEIERKWPQD